MDNQTMLKTVKEDTKEENLVKEKQDLSFERMETAVNENRVIKFNAILTKRMKMQFYDIFRG